MATTSSCSVLRPSAAASAPRPRPASRGSTELFTRLPPCEVGGRDSFLTEIWIDEVARNRGAGAEVLARLAAELRARDVMALHLQVRRDNPALHLYERSGFVASPRIVMTRRL